MKKIFNENTFNIHFKDDYIKLGARRRKNIQIRNDLLTKFEEISYFSGYPISKMVDVLLIEMMQSNETVNSFLNKVKKY